MGIDGFYSWIRKEFSSAIKKNVNNYIQFNHIYIDINYLLHMYYNESKLKDKLKRLEETIFNICCNYHPLQSLTLSCDGAAPLAKLFLQRKRRLDEIRKYDDNKDVNNSSLNFTPGTKFMNELDIKLKSLKEKIELTFGITVNILNNTVGEAEIKNKDEINKNLTANPNSSHLLITNDADVLLIVSATINYKNIYILIKDDLISLNKIIDLKNQKFGSSKYPQLDFAFLNLLNGNDYFPKLKYITIDKLWIGYSKWNFKYKNLLNFENNKITVNNEYLIKILRTCCNNINRNILYKTKLTDSSPETIDNYIEGIKWCFDMYFNGKYKSNTYIYPGSDNKICPLILSTYLLNYPIDLEYSNYQVINITNEYCAIFLLPAQALSLIEDKYKSFPNKYPNLYEEENCIDCKKYHKEMGELNKKYKENLKDKETKKLISSTQKIYTTHRSIHKQLNIDTIEYILSDL